MATYNTLTEQVQRLYSRNIRREDTKGVLDKREVKLMLIQAINKRLRLEVLESFTEGGLTIPDSMIASYNAIAVASAGGVSSITLPAIPIQLPMQMGVWLVLDPADPSDPFIPLSNSEYRNIQTTHTSYLEGQVGYYVEGKTLTFTTDIANAATPIPNVDLRLLINDPANITDTELLPIPADMESDLINEVLEMLSAGQFSINELQKPEEQPDDNGVEK